MLWAHFVSFGALSYLASRFFGVFSLFGQLGKNILDFIHGQGW
jgi:hypothetical protein